MVSRSHRRVRMRLTALLQWTSPFAQKIELVETMDVSRGGLPVDVAVCPDVERLLPSIIDFRATPSVRYTGTLIKTTRLINDRFP